MSTLEKLNDDLDKEQKIMEVHKQNGNYDEAQKSRLKIEQLKNDLLNRGLYETGQRHNREHQDLRKSNSDQLASFNDFWNKRSNDIAEEGNRSESEMNARHSQEQQNTRQQLQIDFSPKTKESSELLNLRKMEQHMVKQKNFAEAHRVQGQVNAMEKQQKKNWMDKRNERIETALATLRHKQNVELTNLQKRYKTLQDELLTDRKIQETRLLQKHDNLQRDMKSQHDKELLNLRGQFRSKGGKDSPMRTRSTFNQ